MQFRPCIDIHNGRVKQIVGGSLTDKNNDAKENFVSDKDSVYFANLYKASNLKGGHVILLNHKDSEYYEATKKEAINALMAYPNGLQVGGGINPDNAESFLKSGASHVIVTSYVFNNGKIDDNALMRMTSAVGKEHLVLDLSVRAREDGYYIVTDRWQKFTDVKLSSEVIFNLSSYCDEFLVHAADVEGLSNGIEENVVKILASSPIEVTYAGGVHNIDDINLLKALGNDKVNVTVGSALDIFGGKIKFQDIVDICK